MPKNDSADDRRHKAAIIFAALLLADIFVWHKVFRGPEAETSAISFLDVGQGDAALVSFSGGVHSLIDAGPDAKVVGELERAVPGKKYIDLAIISHPQLDHFNGFRALLRHYRFGAFIVNGRGSNSTENEWNDLLVSLREKSIPLVILEEGDEIGYGENKILFLSPGRGFIQSAELNDTAFVNMIETPEFHALFTGDIGVNVEEELLRSGADLRADILKVGHHGSKYSSSEAFLKAVRPKVALIGVGENRYGHPAPAVLDRLKDLKITTLRTDTQGSIKIFSTETVLRVFTDAQSPTETR